MDCLYSYIFLLYLLLFSLAASSSRTGGGGRLSRRVDVGLPLVFGLRLRRVGALRRRHVRLRLQRHQRRSHSHHGALVARLFRRSLGRRRHLGRVSRLRRHRRHHRGQIPQVRIRFHLHFIFSTFHFIRIVSCLSFIGLEVNDLMLVKGYSKESVS